ncbi:MAG: hypothetical protein PVSMB7_25170 [Chloroflexota bacterium]
MYILQGPMTVDNQDLRRGKLPDIRTEEDRITFLLTIGVPNGACSQLVLRCERDGEIYASIRPATVKDRR